MTEEPSPPTVVVLDTNVFLHFQPVDQWDWSRLLALPARLLVCAEVLRELDEIKDRGESRAKKDRARSALALAERAMDGPVALRDGVTLVVAPFAPASDAFVDGLSAEVADDRILAAAVAQRDGDATVVFVSNDTTPRLRANAIGLRAIVPPDDLRLREVEDPRDAEIRRLNDRLRAIERTVPRPLLRFVGGERSIAVAVPDAELLGDEPSAPAAVLHAAKPFRAEAKSEERRTEQQAGQADPALKLVPGFAALSPAMAHAAAHAASFMAPTAEQVEAYNHEVDRFHREYPDAYERWQAFREQMLSVLVFRLELENEGTAPAEHPDVYLRIAAKHAGRFAIVTPDTLPRPPRIPKRPGQPTRFSAQPEAAFGTNALLGIGESGPPGLDGTPTRGDWLLGSNRVPSPRFVDYAEDATSIRFGHQKLKHGFRLPFGPFAVRRLDPTARGCSLDYEVHADNLPEPVVGSLHLRFSE